MGSVWCRISALWISTRCTEGFLDSTLMINRFSCLLELLF